MNRTIRNLAIVLSVLITEVAYTQQHRVDPRNMYERVLAVVPWTGGRWPGGDAGEPEAADVRANARANAVGCRFANRDSGVSVHAQR